MGAISKEMFYKNNVKITCDMCHVWSKSCMKAWLLFMPKAAVGCAQYFLPVYLVKAALNYDKIDESYAKHLIRGYFRTIFYGYCYVYMYFIPNCILSNICGRIHYYNIGLFSGFIAGLSVFIESNANRNLNSHYYFHLLIEAAIKNCEYMGLIKWTKNKETIFFMLCSSIVSYLMKQQSATPYINLWFHSSRQYKSRKSTLENKENLKNENCVHDQSCERHIFHGFYKYFVAGYVLEIVKFVMGKYELILKNPKMIGQMLFNKNNVLFGLVTGGYVTLYRTIICTFTKRDGGEQNYHHLIAGLLSGSTFFIKPNLQFACVGFTTLMQLLLQRVQNRANLSEKWNGILFATISGILLHNRFVLSETCPKFVKDMVRITTSGLDKNVIKVLNDIKRR